jgi:hypothetical protein
MIAFQSPHIIACVLDCGSPLPLSHCPWEAIAPEPLRPLRVLQSVFIGVHAPVPRSLGEGGWLKNNFAKRTHPSVASVPSCSKFALCISPSSITRQALPAYASQCQPPLPPPPSRINPNQTLPRLPRSTWFHVACRQINFRTNQKPTEADQKMKSTLDLSCEGRRSWASSET